MQQVVKQVLIALVVVVQGAVSAFGEEIVPIPITAEEAFFAVQTQTDPLSGSEARVALIDVRTRAEFFWVGTACQVNQIVTQNGNSIVPDLGRAVLSRDGRFLLFSLDGRSRKIQVAKVASMALSPIARSIPYKLWDEETAGMVANEDFKDDVLALYAEGYTTVIFFCRSGGRSEECLELPEGEEWPFTALYEIDHPDGGEANGFGGFEGTSYGNVYNGYRGFPERLTEMQEYPSVSWKDAGLPIKTGIKPVQ